MGTSNKAKVQFVISHLEGCSGNFLGYLAANVGSTDQKIFRVDLTEHDIVLSTNGRTSWQEEIDSRLQNHRVVVTHNYNRTQIQKTFPNARLIQIYPYTHIGNVLYNICHKKVELKFDNLVDNYFLEIDIWFKKIKQQQPDYLCTDFWCLHDKNKISDLLGIKLLPTQNQFFDQYWKNQLKHELDIPAYEMSIGELIKFWNIEQDFSPWNIAWTIFVYEHINSLNEQNRMWSINNADQFDCWNTVINAIESNYLSH